MRRYGPAEDEWKEIVPNLINAGDAVSEFEHSFHSAQFDECQ